MSSLGEFSVLGEIVILKMCLENVFVLIFSIMIITDTDFPGGPGAKTL